MRTPFDAAPEGDMGRVTLQTIADEVGVSRMTVSNAFSRPDQLSTQLRETILATAERLGYAGPDPAGRALARGRSGSIGVLLTGSPSDAFADEVSTGFLGAVARAVAPSGLSITLLHSTGSGGVVPARDLAMDGALIYSCESHDEAVAWLTRRGLPLVHVDFTPGTGLISINIDDAGGARQAARHLIGLGHREVAILVDAMVDDTPGSEPADPAYHVELERLRGWREGLAAGGVTPRVLWPETSERSEAPYERARLMATRALAAPDRPTAILAYSDLAASGVLRAATDLGLRVPDDVSVVGFDDNPLAIRVTPRLTTVRQDLEAKGRAAADELLAAMERARRGEDPQERSIVLPTEFIVRESTAPPA